MVEKSKLSKIMLGPPSPIKFAKFPQNVHGVIYDPEAVDHYISSCAYSLKCCVANLRHDTSSWDRGWLGMY